LDDGEDEVDGENEVDVYSFVLNLPTLKRSKK
jgi:hypothetical protein